MYIVRNEVYGQRWTYPLSIRSSVVTQLNINGTMNETDFSSIKDYLPDMRRFTFKQENFRQMNFRISANFNFQSNIWISGGFQIRENTWAENQPRFPILNDRLYLIHKPATGADHFGAIYCGDNLGEQDFKVR